MRFRGKGDGSGVCSEGGWHAKVTIFTSGTNPNSEISRFRSETRLHLKFAFASQPQGLCWVGGVWNVGGVGTTPSSRFVNCSVRALCVHSEPCEIEHGLECGLGKQVKPRSTIRLGRMYGTKQ